jgi:penicillin-binding protein 1A
VEEGRSPFDKLLDAPFYHVDDLGRPYEPENNDEKYKGLIPLKQALAESRNVPTIRLAKALGIEKVIEVAHRFGIERDFVPVLPIALGAGEITLQEITSAFSTFANRGVRAKPYFVRRVEDYNGQTLEEHQTEFEQVISPEVTAKMLYLLQQVVQVGTAQKAKVLNRPMGGKTGTTNESMDTWFVGLLPQITSGAWVGYDEKKSLGEKVYGATTALPIWIDFMTRIQDKFEPIEFEEVWQPTPQDLASSDIILPEGESQLESISVENIPPPGTNVEEEEEGEGEAGESPPTKPPGI